MWTCISQKTDGDAHNLIKGLDDSPKINGVRAWQKLKKEAEGQEDTARERLHDQVHSPVKITKMEQVAIGVEEWELLVRRLEASKGEPLEPTSKLKIFKRMLPMTLQDSIAQRGVVGETYYQVKKYSIRFAIPHQPIGGKRPV